MPVITLHTFIKADPEICFNLSRSVDIHLCSTARTGERVVKGRASGLLEPNEDITWRAKHLGVTQDLTSRITEYDFPVRFVSEMQKGIFRKLHHQHLFSKEGLGTRMTDVFDFEAPMGFLGDIACSLFLTNYMTGFLLERNETIRRMAEADES
jgi:ligand-binding SRPBCC domain-containing protein